MPEPLIRSNLNLAFDVLCDLASQITFNSQICIDVLTNPHNLTISEISHLGATIDIEVIEDAVRSSQSHPKNVGEPDLDTLISWKVCSRNTSHKSITPDAACDAGC